MRVDHDLPATGAVTRDSAVTIGNFDGVHRGHQALIERVVANAREHDRDAVVVTFDPHPVCLLRPAARPATLTTVAQKAELMEGLGVDRLVVINFTQAVSEWSAEEFAQKLSDSLRMRHVVAGHDFAFGHQRRGTMAFLREFGEGHGFDTGEATAVLEGGKPVSSSRVREALDRGETPEALRLLGRCFFVDGIVEHGDKVGRTLGFPTANVTPRAGHALPRTGIYTSWVRVGSDWHPAATNVGVRPTFNGTRLLVEPHLLDFDGDLYDQPIRIAFAERLRDEVRFEGIEALIEQMRLDVSKTRERLTEASPPAHLG